MNNYSSSSESSPISSKKLPTPPPSNTNDKKRTRKQKQLQSPKNILSSPDSIHNNNKRKAKSSNLLRKTISDFGDDVIKVKSTKEFQEAANSMMEGHYNLNLDHTLFQQPFERISPNDINSKKSSTWKSLMNVSIASNVLKSRDNKMENNSSFDNSDAQALQTLFSMVHTIGRFSSIVLCGFYVLQAIEMITWRSGFNQVTPNWVFVRVYRSLSTLLLLMTSLGFLIRVDISQLGGTIKFIISLFPVLLMNVCDYLHKGWEFQAIECHTYHNLEPEAQNTVYLTQNCPKNISYNVGVGILVSKILLASCSVFVAGLMFVDNDGVSRYGKGVKKDEVY